MKKRKTKTKAKKQAIVKKQTTVKNGKAQLIDNSFFGSSVGVTLNRVYPMLVTATMSSGKSTLINALLGNDVLPSKNEACTAKVYAILDDDTSEKTRLVITRKDGEVKTVEENISEELNSANDDSDVSDIFIIGQVKGVTNTDKSLLIIDTPGPNNSVDSDHKKIARNVLEKIHGGLIIYVINATQIGTEDDRAHLSFIRELIKDNGEISVVFVLNKIDNIDFERESITEIMSDVKNYITSVGFENPTIIPVSALGAKVMKKALNGEKLTRRENNDFRAAYELFKPGDLSLSSYSIVEGRTDFYDKVTVNDKEYVRADLLSAIENSGLPYLEKFIQEKQILSTKRSKIKITC